jgi:3-phenylpropionate/cinnamic acid dioxygenase small subunit
MAEHNQVPVAEQEMNINDTVILRDVPVGAKVKLRNGAIGEVTANPGDGAWVFFRYVESPDPAQVGTEGNAFATEVIAVVEGGAQAAPTTRLSPAATRASTEELLQQLLLEREIERFLYMEAELLDERRWSEWLELVADDIHYHMPVRRNVKFGEQHRENTDPESEISWFDEYYPTLAGRVRQLNTGIHWCEEPFSRVRHIVSNVQVVSTDGDQAHVRSRFFVYQNRLHDEVNLFVGKREDILRRDPHTGWKIARRTILLDQNVLLAKVFTTFF